MVFCVWKQSYLGTRQTDRRWQPSRTEQNKLQLVFFPLFKPCCFFLLYFFIHKTQYRMQYTVSSYLHSFLFFLSSIYTSSFSLLRPPSTIKLTLWLLLYSLFCCVTDCWGFFSSSFLGFGFGFRFSTGLRFICEQCTL